MNKTKTSQAIEVMKKIEQKKKEFSLKAKQCSYCGGYYGDLHNEIEGLISEQQTMLSCFKEERKFLDSLFSWEGNIKLSFISYLNARINDLSSAIKVLEGEKE